MQMEDEFQSLMDAAGHELDKPALTVVDRAVREQHPAAFALLRNLLTKDGGSPFIRAALASYTRTFPNQEAEHLLLSILAARGKSRVLDFNSQVREWVLHESGNRCYYTPDCSDGRVAR